MSRSCELSFPPEVIEEAEYPGFAYPATIQESIEAGVPVVLQATVLQGARRFKGVRDRLDFYRGLQPCYVLDVWMGVRNDFDTHAHTISTSTILEDEDFALALARKADVADRMWQAPNLQAVLNPPPTSKTTFSDRAFTPIRYSLGGPTCIRESDGRLGWFDIPDRQVGLSNGGEKMLLSKLYLNDYIAEASPTAPVAKIRQDNWLGGYSYEGDGVTHRVKPLIMIGTVVLLGSEITMPGACHPYKGSTKEFPILRRIPVEKYLIGLENQDVNMLLPDVDQDEELFACINGMCLVAGRYAISSLMELDYLYHDTVRLSFDMGQRQYEEWSAREWAKHNASLEAELSQGAL